ncbi:triacylglycerol lipase [Nocardioides sp. SYSU D00038]|uniref:esterase/lipase family protein n=1 Tax=Nocardioides sp. SYSU D00038 TaxID=2812554 RepID=UPI0019681DC1|nr:alpha/beta fold hydrolase [Nocardioides sp. SYSU D00038]
MSLLTRVLTCVAVAVATVSGPLVTASAAAPSSGYDDWSCRPSPAHPRPVVMLHGLSGMSQQWSLHGPAVARAGYCVFTLDYGANAMGLNGNAPVERSATEISAYVDRVLAETGAARVDLVGHSLGGFLALWVPKLAGDPGRFGRVVALTPPTHGTTLLGLVALVDGAGLRATVDTLLGAAGCLACVDLLAGSRAVARLEAGPIAQPGVAYTVVATRYDAVVTPPARGFVREPGVTNYLVQDRCPLDPVGHFGIGFDTGVTSMILNGLDPAVPVRCGVGPPV